MKRGWGVKPLRATRIPASSIVLAILARSDRTRAGHTEGWLCAEARYVHGWPWAAQAEESRCHWQQDDLWTQVSNHCKGKGLTFLWMHDLHRAVRVTAALEWLPRLNWRLDKLSLNPLSSWLVWRKGHDTLKIVDVMSVWPTSLDRIGQLFGLSRIAVHVDELPDLTLRNIAVRDNVILSTAVACYQHWIDYANLGTLSVTGNGQAWNAFRRNHIDHGILVHHDDELHEMERRAMWTGRAEAWWRGAWLDQPVDEWDFSTAHLQICAEEDMPVFPHRPLAPDESLAEILDEDKYLVLAEIEVDIDVPCLPAVLGAGIGWPVGRIVTTVWTPEIRLAVDHGRNLRVRRGWLYRRAPALRGWADWCLSQLTADDEKVPAWRKDIIKRWGNTLVGRFAMRYPRWEHVGQSPTMDVHCTPCVDLQTGEEFSLMQVGFDVWKQSGVDVPHNQAPSITGYVMSVMRAKLWALITLMPDKSLLYMDTDSLLVTDKWRTHLEWMASLGAFRGLRLKRSWEGMAIYGPRQLVTGDRARISGLPRTAVRTGRHDWEGEVTESLLEALAGRRAGEVHMVERQWHLEGKDERRAGPSMGWTLPIHVDQRGGEHAQAGQ